MDSWTSKRKWKLEICYPLKLTSNSCVSQRYPRNKKATYFGNHEELFEKQIINIYNKRKQLAKLLLKSESIISSKPTDIG